MGWTRKRPTLTAKSRSKVKDPGLRDGYRSGLEDKTAAWLKERGIAVKYEDPEAVIKYVRPQKVARYTPDFILPNGIIVETKGRFVTADRQKHLLIKQQFPEKDIRFVFSNSKATISKVSKTSYAKWCTDHGFQYADKVIPEEWLSEKPKVE